MEEGFSAYLDSTIKSSTNSISFTAIGLKFTELYSLDYVDLVVVIEENFGFKVTGEDFKDVITFDDFYNLVEKKLAN